MKLIRFCNNCQNTKENTAIPTMFFSNKFDEDIIKQYFAGYIYGIQESYWENTDKCPFCQNVVSCLNISEDDVYTLFVASNGNRQLLDAMIDLHDKDIIEYELKMSQFRNQVEQRKCVQNTQQENTDVHCPYCKSTNVKKISASSRVGSVMILGIFSKKIGKQWHCNSCGSDF